MKKVLVAAAITVGIFAVSWNNPAFAAAETKRVCVEQTDPKTKKPKQVCREVKIHKKLEGTPVPPPKQGK
jgi:signal recognition particle subunit SEC65